MPKEMHEAAPAAPTAFAHLTVLPQGPLLSPTGHLSNYPPLGAIRSKGGISKEIWTGSKHHEKGQFITGGFFVTRNGLAASPYGPQPLTLPKVRIAPAPRLDSINDSAIETRGMINCHPWDLALVARKY